MDEEDLQAGKGQTIEDLTSEEMLAYLVEMFERPRRQFYWEFTIKEFMEQLSMKNRRHVQTLLDNAVADGRMYKRFVTLKGGRTNVFGAIEMLDSLPEWARREL